MATTRRLRLPGIRALLLGVTALSLVPILILVRSDLASSSEQFEGAREAAEHVEHTDAWLRLTAGMSGEISTAVAQLEAQAVPPVLQAALGIEFEPAVIEARAEVDRQLARLDADDIREAVSDVRARVDAGELTTEQMLVEMFMIRDRVEMAASRERAVLIETLGGLDGAAEVLRSIEVARAAALVTVFTNDEMTRWARIAAPFGTPTPAEIRAFTDATTRRHGAVADLEALLLPGSEIEQSWHSIRADPDHVMVRQTYVDTLVELDLRSSGADGGTDDAQLAEFLERIDFTLETVEALVSTNIRTYELFETTMDDAAAANEELVAAAQSQRVDMLWTFGLLAVMAAFVWLVLARIIARPIARLGEVVDAAGDGDLGRRADVAGPREVRETAAALNHALDTMQHVEAQAIALADERLDDPALAASGPGQLGASLQAAVERLTTTLNEREEFRRQLAHEASHDGLTMLPNRNAILGRLDAALARAARSETSIALLFLDLDDFKSVNDVHGHAAGDAFLRSIAERIGMAVRRGDQVGRIGGDEFVVVAEPVADLDTAIELAERIRAAVAEPLSIAGAPIEPSISIGVAMADGVGLTAEEIVRDADLAVYRAKDLGRNRVEVCDEDLRQQMTDRKQSEVAIRDGLDRREFVLHFQPIVSAGNGALTMLEALVRWDRPGSGQLSPAEFIPVAERSDLIIALDRYVLDRALEQIVEWDGAGRFVDVPVSVNVSSRHLSSGGLADDVEERLVRTGVDPTRLVIEITETALMDHIEPVNDDLVRLRELGVRVALDDFGTGYMSLATLRHLHVDVLKIDRSFVNCLDRSTERSLVELMVNTGHLLGVDVTAEGVETASQQSALIEMGCDRLQGFLFSRPVAAADLDAASLGGAAPCSR